MTFSLEYSIFLLFGAITIHYRTFIVLLPKGLQLAFICKLLALFLRLYNPRSASESICCLI